MPKVSIVIPVYKVENFLRECLDSVINQTLKDIEIIIVDDGSPDKCPQICDEYAQKDSRIKVIHKENGGYGTACNTGIAAASGDYIGLVESDDWIEPDMYEKLYNQIIKFDADVCICSFYEYKGKIFQNKPYLETIENIDDTNTFSIMTHPYLYTVHPSVWSKLYNAKFIKNIKFDETPQASYQDGPFITEVYCKAKKIIGLKDYLYHYRVDNTNASSCNANKSKKLIQILSQWQIAKDILKRYNMFESLKEEFYFQCSKSGYRFYKNIHPKYRKEFFEKWKKFAEDLKEDENFTYKYFNDQRKHFLQCVIQNKYRESQFDKYKSYNILGYPIIEKTVRNNKEKHRFLNIPYFKKIKKNGYTKRKYLFGIFKIRENNKYKKYYILGIQIHLYKKQQSIDFLQLAENQHIQNLAIVTHNYLKAYKDIYTDKEIIIVACGQTLKYYDESPDKIYIGVNRAFNKNINLDYLFIQDLFPEGMTDADNYQGNNCKKFYGILSNHHCTKFAHCKRIPPASVKKANASLYYLESIISHNWPYDISIEPFGEFKSTVFSALQFALYTNPKRIYLTGCDCDTNGYFYGNDGIHKYEHLIEQWVKAKKHIQTLYPDIEIISINPVGLKGLFKDVYTESYLKDHPELKNVEVLKEEKKEALCV